MRIGCFFIWFWSARFEECEEDQSESAKIKHPFEFYCGWEGEPALGCGERATEVYSPVDADGDEEAD